MSRVEDYLRTARILVVDDNRHMRQLALTILRSVCHNKDCREAVNGAEALQILKEWPADLVLTDVVMAPCDGIALVRMIRDGHDGVNKFIPVVMMSSESHHRHILQAMEAGANGFVAKPFTSKSLVDRMGKVFKTPVDFIEIPEALGLGKPFFGPNTRWAQTHFRDALERTGGGSVMKTEQTVIPVSEDADDIDLLFAQMGVSQRVGE